MDDKMWIITIMIACFLAGLLTTMIQIYFDISPLIHFLVFFSILGFIYGWKKCKDKKNKKESGLE